MALDTVCAESTILLTRNSHPFIASILTNSILYRNVVNYPYRRGV